MAKHRYRYAGSTNWHSMSGNAVLAIVNPVGSGRKIKVSSLEIGSANVDDSINASVTAALLLGDSNGGDVIGYARHDTSGFTPEITLTKGGAVSVISGVVKRVSNLYHMALGAVFTNLAGSRSNRWTWLGGNRAKNMTDVEDVIVRGGETISLVVLNMRSKNYMNQRVNVSFWVKDGSTKKTFSAGFFMSARCAYHAFFSLKVNAGSTQTAGIISWCIEPSGTTHTPYFRLVPIGSVDALAMTDDANQLSLARFDTASPVLSTSQCRVLTDVPILPFGMPQVAITDFSTGSPKGYNYLQCKDFDGPSPRVFFAEISTPAIGGSIRPDDLGAARSQRICNLVERAEYVIRPGEGLAVVSSAETAVTTNPVGTSGAFAFDFGLTVSVENETSPSLTLTGLKEGSDVVILEAGTETVLAESYGHSATSLSYSYDPDVITSVDVVITHVAYEYYRLEGLPIGAGGATVPIGQRIDRNYRDPITTVHATDALWLNRARQRVLQTFDAVVSNDPITETVNGITYTVRTDNAGFSNGFMNYFVGGVDTAILTSDAADKFIIELTGGNPSAIAFDVHLVDGSYVDTGGETIRITLSDGTVKELSPSSPTYVGFTSTSPITSVTIENISASPTLFLVLNNLKIGYTYAG